MKSFFLLSALLNAVLVAVGGVTLSQRSGRHVAVTPPPEMLAGNLPKVHQDPMAADAVSSATPEPFRWSQLESSDDAVYAGNLRAVGCPESTIRDILTAAVARRFDQKRAGLMAQHKSGAIDAGALQQALAETWEEQNNTVGSLPGGPRNTSTAPSANTPLHASAPVSAVTPSPSALSPAGTVTASDPNIRMPLAMSPPSPSSGLSDAQMAAAASVADGFAKAVGSQSASPTSPAYHQIWEQSQEDADEILKAKIGWEAYSIWEHSHPGQ